MCARNTPFVTVVVHLLRLQSEVHLMPQNKSQNQDKSDSQSRGQHQGQDNSETRQALFEL